MKCVVLLLLNLIMLIRITSNVDRAEEPFERYSTVCSECRNKILKVFPKIEDDFFLKVLYNSKGYLFFKINIGDYYKILFLEI